MERAVLLITITILLIGLATADVTVAETTSIETEQPTIFVSAAENTLAFTARAAVSDVHIFLDGVLLKQYPTLTIGVTETVTTPLTGEHVVEIRFLREHKYVWERPDITTNDAPAELKYVEYDKDKKKVDFSITGADFVHPDYLDTTVDNSNEPFTGYNATINNHSSLNCYPRITTGKNLFFSCKSNEYANKLDLKIIIGIKELTVLNTTKETLEEELNVPTIQLPPTPPMPPGINEKETVEIPRMNNITMIDTIKQSNVPLPVTVFIILLFLAVMTIMFIASHHKHENKQAGTHHPLKKK